MKRLLFIFLSILFFSISASAQKEETVFGYSGLRLTGAWGGPSSGMAKYGDDYAFYQGGFGGLEFNNALFIGWGAYHLQEDVELNNFPNQDFDFQYKGLMIGYAIKPNKILHPKVTLLGGGGTVDIENEGREKVIVIQPAIGLELNIFKWWHLSLEGGYRIIADTDIPRLSDTDLSTPFAELKFKFGYSWGW